MKSSKQRKRPGWFEEYDCCGCVSETVPRRKDLLGYCGQHGNNRRGVFRDFGFATAQVERTSVGQRNEEHLADPLSQTSDSVSVERDKKDLGEPGGV